MASSAEMYAPLRCSCGGEARLACANGCDDPELEHRTGPFTPLTQTRAPTTRLRAGELAEARNAEVVRRYQAGEQLADIGATYGITGERCRQILAACGVARRPPTRHSGAEGG